MIDTYLYRTKWSNGQDEEKYKPTARKMCLHVRRFKSHYCHLTFIRIISDKV